jgi:16S rRNA (cytosine1402-N4)-methyltransferase
MDERLNAEQSPRKRRARYSGKNPRRFDQKYKEHAPERYTDDIVKIIQSGKTPAGSHRPICVQEILQVLNPQPGHIVLDATLGYGGHSREILKRITPGGCLWGTDVDPIEIKKTEARLRELGYSEKEFQARHLNFAGIPKIMDEVGTRFDLILADLGVSSMQLDDPKRGFTFKTEGPLDLRLNPAKGQPASELLSSMSEKELEKILRDNADEPYAHGIARMIFRASDRMKTTTALADAIRRALPKASSDEEKEDIAKSVQRTFQAIRIAVNNEFIVLEQFLKNLPACLKPGGKAAILTFHSGEDNRVIHSFEEGIASGLYNDMGREAIRPTPQERYDNPRSKSAILRWAQRSNNA